MTSAAMFVAIFLLQNVVVPACQWSTPREVGTLEAPIEEGSGLAISRRYPDRLYHVNDSGDSGRFFTTDFSGRNLRIIDVAGFAPRDAEALSLGACSATTDCIFIGDIGDNSRKRRFIEMVVIEEQEKFAPRVQTKYRVQMRYPGQAQNAEALAVHPNGDVFILTKGGTPQILRLKKQQWMNPGNRIQTLEHIVTIDFAKLGGPAASMDGRLPTDMAISPDGKQVLVLTYRNVFEVFLDLSAPLPPLSTWKAGVHFRRINVEALAQQEGIAYTSDGRSFLYDTERFPGSRASIMRSDCRH